MERQNPVLQIPPGIWLLVSKHLALSTCKTLSIVSKYFHGIWTPILYHSVNLSVHHFRPITDKDNFILQRWLDNLQEILGR